MDENRDLTDLEQMLDRIEEAAQDKERVSLEMVMKVVGQRSFGPLLLLAGLITFAPIIGDIPGVPTLIGIFVFLISGQLLIRRDHLWLPQWLLKRSVDQTKLCKAVKWMRSPARFVDKFLRPRLTFLTHSKGIYAIAIVCILIALAMPVMEVVPFSANGAGAALTFFGVALIAHDGLMAVIAFTFTITTFVLAIFGLI